MFTGKRMRLFSVLRITWKEEAIHENKIVIHTEGGPDISIRGSFF